MTRPRFALSFVLVVALATTVTAQSRNSARADIGERNGKTVMFAAYNLMADPFSDCVLRRFSGTIIKVHHDTEYAVRIDGFTLFDTKRQRIYFNVEQELYEDVRLPRSDIGWLPTLIKVNNRVKVDSYVCGPSGGVALAHNIIALPARRR